jgi:hypothetical protein
MVSFNSKAATTHFANALFQLAISQRITDCGLGCVSIWMLLAPLDALRLHELFTMRLLCTSAIVLAHVVILFPMLLYSRFNAQFALVEVPIRHSRMPIKLR